MQDRKDAPEIRCGQCNRLLGKGIALELAIKCPRCGCINHVKARTPETARKDMRNE
jgi:phage FluMu protein Com